MTKKGFIAQVRAMGGEAHYQGKTKTMFVKSPVEWDDIDPFARYFSIRYQSQVSFTIKPNTNGDIN